MPEYPDIPTYGEGGYPFVAISWVGMFAPAKVGGRYKFKSWPG